MVHWYQQKSISIYTLLIFIRLRAQYISMCLLFTVVSLTNFSRSRLAVSGARPFQRGRMLESLSKKCFFIFFKARLVPLICSTLTQSTSQAVLQAERQPRMTHSNCENSTTSEVLNSTEHSGIFSFRWWICIGLRSLCLVFLLVVLILIQFVWINAGKPVFLFSCFKHVLGNLFAFILARLSFFLQSCVLHYFVIVVMLVFFGKSVILYF